MMLRLPPEACLTAASKTRTEARQMSGPVPSPSMNGMMGWSGTIQCPSRNSIRAPAAPPRRPSAGGWEGMAPSLPLHRTNWKQENEKARLAAGLLYMLCSMLCVVLPADRETGAQHEVVLELAAAVEVAAVEVVFRFQPQADGLRERNPEAQADYATPIGDAFILDAHVPAAANQRRTAGQEDAEVGVLRGQAEQQLEPADEHLGIALFIDGRAGHAHARGREAAGQLEADRATSPARNARAHDEAVVAADIATHRLECIPRGHIGARPRRKGEAALRGRGSCAQRANDADQRERARKDSRASNHKVPPYGV